jgi:hypothetical protein
MRTFSPASTPALIAGLLGLAAAAQADVIMPLDYNFSGGQPAGSAPWVHAAFTEITGGVRLTITANLQPGESIRRFIFNVAEPRTGAQILNTNTTGPSWFQILGKSSNPGSVNAFQAPGDGYFDFRIDWHEGIFTGGQVFTMSFIGSYNPEMFDIVSEGGILRSAALVGSPQGDIGWVGNVPAPSSLALLAAGGVLMSRRRRA